MVRRCSGEIPVSRKKNHRVRVTTGSPLSAIVGTNTDRATSYLLLPHKYNDKISMARVGIRARPFEISAAFEDFGNAREENPRILVNLLRFVGKKMVLLLIYPGLRTFKLLASSI